MIRTTIKSCAKSLLLAVALGAASVAAQAQTTTPLPSHSLRDEAREVLAALQLTPMQRLELYGLLLRAQDLRNTVAADVDALLSHASSELADPNADLYALVLQREALVDARLANARQLRDELLSFYSSDLSPAQQAQVRQFLLTRVERIERTRSALQDLRAAWLMP